MLHVIGHAFGNFSVDFDGYLDLAAGKCRKVLQDFFRNLPHVTTGSVRIDLDRAKEASWQARTRCPLQSPYNGAPGIDHEP